MSLKTALNNLGSLNVVGIAHNYGINDLPESLSRAQLPALLVIPIDKQADSFYQERGLAFTAAAFANGTKSARFVVNHLLLLAPVKQGEGMREHLETLADGIDAYMEAIAADLTLDGALEEAAQVSIETGIFSHGTGQYYGCAFRHTWLIGY